MSPSYEQGEAFRHGVTTDGLHIVSVFFGEERFSWLTLFFRSHVVHGNFNKHEMSPVKSHHIHPSSFGWGCIYVAFVFKNWKENLDLQPCLSAQINIFVTANVSLQLLLDHFIISRNHQRSSFLAACYCLEMDTTPLAHHMMCRLLLYVCFSFLGWNCVSKKKPLLDTTIFNLCSFFCKFASFPMKWSVLESKPRFSTPPPSRRCMPVMLEETGVVYAAESKTFRAVYMRHIQPTTNRKKIFYTKKRVSHTTSHHEETPSRPRSSILLSSGWVGIFFYSSVTGGSFLSARSQGALVHINHIDDDVI